MLRPCASSWPRRRCSIKSTISVTSSLESSWNTITSSIAVEELGPEVLLQGLVDLCAHLVVADGLVGLGEPDRGLAQVGGPQVGRHDYDRVLEVDSAALCVGEPAVLEDLQQGIEHVGMGLFDLVEQHDRERLAPDRLGQLAALLVTDVPRR